MAISVLSKMAVSRHLKFYRTANNVIRSAYPENRRYIEPNMEWIGCTNWETFAFKLHAYCALKLRFGSLKVIENGTIR